MEKHVLARVLALPKMTTKELQEIWKEMFNKDAPKMHKTLLVKKLAYQIQKIAYGGSDDIEKRIAEHANNYFGSGGNKQKRKTSYHSPIVGTKLVREYKGIEHQVTVLGDGFEYQNCKYTSLSKIAGEITGVAWSGPAFFGLTSKKGDRS